MNCRNARANFSKYIEQELCEIERRDIAAHLARCPKCSSDLFAMQKAMSLLRWVPRYEGSPDFDERLMERIRAEEVSPSGLAAIRDRLEGLGERWREMVAATVVPAPAAALFVAMILGGGIGAIMAGGLGGTAEVPSGTVVATTPEILSAPDVAVANGSLNHPADELVPGGSSEMAPGESRSPELASASEMSPSDVEDRFDVAPWATGGQRLEAVPEGPPSISHTEYVLEWVDRSGAQVEQLPVSAVVANGTVTF